MGCCARTRYSSFHRVASTWQTACQKLCSGTHQFAKINDGFRRASGGSVPRELVWLYR
jgi:hypothetical protein